MAQEEEVAIFGTVFGVAILVVGCIYGLGCYYRLRSFEPRVPEQNNIESI
jgi:hypothetical protein